MSIAVMFLPCAALIVFGIVVFFNNPRKLIWKIVTKLTGVGIIYGGYSLMTLFFTHLK